MRTQNLEIADQTLRRFCEKHQIARLALFGSVLRDDFSPASDVDVLVEFDPAARVGLIRFATIEQALSDLFGRSVDLNTVEFLSKYFRDEVLSEAEYLYDETQ